MLKNAIRIGLTFTMGAALLGICAPSASAATRYSSDECSSSVSCFGIFYNSRTTGSQFISSCFLTNDDEYSHEGYEAITSGGLDVVKYQFDDNNRFQFNIGVGHWCTTGEGAGQGVKNNAAGGVNNDTHTHRVYYNSGYGGTAQSFSAGTSANLISALKNNNASSERI